MGRVLVTREDIAESGEASEKVTPHADALVQPQAIASSIQDNAVEGGDKANTKRLTAKFYQRDAISLIQIVEIVTSKAGGKSVADMGLLEVLSIEADYIMAELSDDEFEVLLQQAMTHPSLQDYVAEVLQGEKLAENDWKFGEDAEGRYEDLKEFIAWLAMPRSVEKMIPDNVNVNDVEIDADAGSDIGSDDSKMNVLPETGKPWHYVSKISSEFRLNNFSISISFQ